MSLAKETYKLVSKFPREEKFGIISQMKRAAVSVPANIAEGWSRNHTKKFIQFLYIAIGFLAELETFIGISNNLGYVKNTESSKYMDAEIGNTRKMIYAMIKSLSSRL